MTKRYYSLVTEERTADIYIFGDITSFEWLDSDVSSYSLVQDIQGLDVDTINVHINSYGGEVAEALAIYNVLKRHSASVTTYVDGFACSAATIVFMAGDKRIMSKVGNFLVHPAWVQMKGNAEDLRKEADNLDAITEQSITAYLEHITKSREELIDLMDDERFLIPAEVLEWGFATEIEEEDEIENLRAAASVKSFVHNKIYTVEPFDLDAFAEHIAGLVSEKIKEPEDPEPEPETEEPDEEPGEQQPETEDNQEASVSGCFFDAFKK